MKNKGMFLWLGLMFVLPQKNVLAHAVPPNANQATLTMAVTETNGLGKGICSHSLQNCLVQVTQYPGCQAPGSVTITNNSNAVAKNIQATSTDSNFNNFVVKNNGCAPTLAPGASCIISFYTSNAAQFFISNISVKGTNTNTAFFDMQAVPCIPQAQLTVTPTSLTFDIATTGQITITNQSTTVDADNLQAIIPSGSSISIDTSSSTCFFGIPLPHSSSCTAVFQANAVESNVPISIQSNNSTPVPIQVSTVSQVPILTLSTTSISIPINLPIGINVQVSNSTSIPATGVHFDLSGTGWSDVTSSTCTVPANGSCLINLVSSSATAHLAQAGIPLAGDNLINPPTIAIAFESGGGLVFAVDSVNHLAKVISNTTSLAPWSPTSVSLGSGAQSPSDGATNTNTIVGYYGPSGGTAANYCNTLTDGGANQGEWYLPAICEWSNGPFVSCGIDNVATNLFNLGFGSFQVAYWSSTEDSASGAWLQQFSSFGSSQTLAIKTSTTQVRCARSIPTL